MRNIPYSIIKLANGKQVVGDINGKSFQFDRNYYIVELVNSTAERIGKIHLNPDHVVAVGFCSEDELAAMGADLNREWLPQSKSRRVGSHAG